ncbi:MAG TPA: hypothetical protein VIM11_19485 [Tepidisphaeraceae bacterium]
MNRPTGRIARKGYRGTTPGLLAAYKPPGVCPATKVAVQVRFEAVLGKTRRTEF